LLKLATKTTKKQVWTVMFYSLLSFCKFVHNYSTAGQQQWCTVSGIGTCIAHCWSGRPRLLHIDLAVWLSIIC